VPLTCFFFLLEERGASGCDMAGAEKWTAAARVLVLKIVIFLIVDRTQHPSVKR